jgi:formylglycine-generating enzyme
MAPQSGTLLRVSNRSRSMNPLRLTLICKLGLALWGLPIAAAASERLAMPMQHDASVAHATSSERLRHAALTAATDSAARHTSQDCPECPEMVTIPSGRFVMGAAPGEEEREYLALDFRNRSAPQRSVNVRSLAVGRYEVTRGQYRVFVQATGRAGDACFVWNADSFELDASKSWRSTGYAQDDRHPATCVSWEDAHAYVKWLSEHTGKTYRLLTEAEWEYAARAGTTSARFWGDDPGQACKHANGADASTQAEVPAARNWHVANCNDGHAHTAPVGTFRPNAFGLHDMLGNVEEWTQDCWNPNHGGAPADASARTAGDCGLGVVRGGSWHDAPVGLRSAYRVGSPVTIRVYSRGFRVARDM